MAHTIKDQYGNGTTQTITGTSSGTAYGPPVTGAPHYQGVFVNESGSGSSRTLRHLKDEYMGAQGTSPTSYTFSAEPRG